ncbi:MAG: trehalase-like domain-containing protein, partial [Streptosporangiaceae bacterium]
MRTTPRIADHGLVGDLQTAALVSTDGEIDWLCLPRFDSPSAFASLLDRDRGGYFRISPAGGQYRSHQLYLPDTAVVITRFMTEEGVGEVVDFMPVSDEVSATDRHRLVRVVRVVRGEMRFAFELFPGFDYGRASHTVEVTDDGAVFRSGDQHVTVHLARLLNLEYEDIRVAGPNGDGLRASATLRAGQVGGAVLEFGPAGPPHRFTPDEAWRLFHDTGWAAGIRLRADQLLDRVRPR